MFRTALYREGIDRQQIHSRGLSYFTHSFEINYVWMDIKLFKKCIFRCCLTARGPYKYVILINVTAVLLLFLC